MTCLRRSPQRQDTFLAQLVPSLHAYTCVINEPFLVYTWRWAQRYNVYISPNTGTHTSVAVVGSTRASACLWCCFGFKYSNIRFNGNLWPQAKKTYILNRLTSRAGSSLFWMEMSWAICPPELTPDSIFFYENKHCVLRSSTTCT